MGTANVDIFKLMAGKMSWLNERQAVLSQNVSNADTPGYKPYDLEPFNFKSFMSQSGTTAGASLQLASSNSGTQIGTGSSNFISSSSQSNDAKADRHPYEVFANGNGVDLEEQLVKSSKNASDYQLMTSLYGQTIAMFKTAIKSS